jgi:hypothetical protein
MLVTLWNACSKHPVVYPFLQSHHRGVRDELRVRDRNRLGSLCGIVRINGITTVLKLISSADTPAAAGVTELFLRIAGVQLCSFAHFVLRREDPFPIHGQNFNELWSRRLGYACRRVTVDIILNLEVSLRAFQPCANSSELSWVLPGTIILVLYALLLENFNAILLVVVLVVSCRVLSCCRSSFSQWKRNLGPLTYRMTLHCLSWIMAGERITLP